MSLEIGTGVQAIVCCHERFELYGFIFMIVSIKKKAVLDPSDNDEKSVAIPSHQNEEIETLSECRTQSKIRDIEKSCSRE